MISFQPTPEQQALRDLANEFGARELAPAAKRVHAEGAHAIDPWPLLRPVAERGAELGLFSLLVPEADGGGGASCMDAALVFEELGAVDVGAAASIFALTASLACLVARAGSAEQKGRWLEPAREGRAFLWSGALSEPDRAGSDLFFPHADPAVGAQTRADRRGDAYLVTGRKSAFVTNAGVADAYFVMARTRFDAPPAEGLTMLAVPGSALGLSFGTRTRLTGWATAHHAELFLDQVQVPARDRIGDENAAGAIFASAPEIPICLAACYVGLARAAHEYAREYARERISWGVPIATHQAVALKLAEGALDVRAARLAVWEAAAAADADPLAGAALAAGAKVLAVDAALRTAQRAVEVLGGYGVAHQYRAARYLNDAWVGWSCDFTRDVLLLGIAAQL